MTLEAMGKSFAPLIARLPAGRIDWTAGQIVAEGSASGERRAAAGQALAKAAANAVALLNELEVGPSGFFLDRHGGGPSVDSALKDFPPAEEHFDPAGATASAVLRIPIHGPRGAVFARQVYYSGWPQWDVPAPNPSATRFDAVVFDARGTGFSPVVYPRVTQPGGEAIFDGFWLRRDGLLPPARPLYVTVAPGGPASLGEVLALAGGKRAIVFRASPPARAERGALVVHGDDQPRLAACANLEDLLLAGQAAIVADPAQRPA